MGGALRPVHAHLDLLVQRRAQLLVLQRGFAALRHDKLIAPWLERWFRWIHGPHRIISKLHRVVMITRVSHATIYKIANPQNIRRQQ